MTTSARTPGRGRVWIAAALPPIIWMLQGAIGWFIVAHACPASVEPLPYGTARVAVGVVTLVALAATIGCIVFAGRVWRELKPSEGESRASTAKSERVRYVAALALMTSVTLTIGVILFGLPSLLLPVCGEVR